MSLGATFAAVIADYVERIDRAGGHLILSGVQSPLLARVERTATPRVAAAIDVFEATEVIGESTNRAIDAGELWLERHAPVTTVDSGKGENDNGATPDEESDVTPS